MPAGRQGWRRQPCKATRMPAGLMQAHCADSCRTAVDLARRLGRDSTSAGKLSSTRASHLKRQRSAGHRHLVLHCSRRGPCRLQVADGQCQEGRQQAPQDLHLHNIPCQSSLDSCTSAANLRRARVQEPGSSNTKPCTREYASQGQARPDLKSAAVQPAHLRRPAAAEAALGGRPHRSR